MAVTLDLDFTATTTLDPRITFSRASLGTYYDSAGVLKYAAHNLVLQSNDFNTTWLKGSGATVTVNAATAPDSTTTADRLNHVTAGTVQGGYVNQNTSDPPYRAIFSVYAKVGSKNRVGVGGSTSTTGTAWFNLAAGTVGTRGANLISSGIESVGDGWYRCWIFLATFGAGSAYIRVAETDGSLTCTSPGDIFIWGAQLENVTTATTPSTYLPTTTAAVHGPRFDYDPVTHVAKGLLIEQTNVLLNGSVSSEDFVTTWTKTGLTATADQTAAPTGVVNADLITASASPAIISESSANATGNTYTYSVYAKKGTSDWFYILLQSTSDAVGTPRAWFNLNTGVVGTVESPITTTTIQNVGNGWYRCSATRVGTTGTARVCGMGISDADNSATVTVGRTIYLWGKLWENNATFPTSYTPHNTTAGNRAADIAVMTGSNFSSWYNQPAGSFIAKFELRSATGTRPVISADNNATAEQILLYGSGGDPKAKVRDNSVDQADLDLGTIAA